MAGSTIDTADKKDQALDGIAAVAPPDAPTPPKDAHSGERVTPDVREGADAESVEALRRDPSDPDAKLHVELDESFPGSDAPSTTRPGSSDPAPSSGYDEEAEKALQNAR